jgi:hypothetical protein
MRSLFLSLLLISTFAQAKIDFAKAILASGVSIPVHGHYCGPNHGDADYSLAPIDAVDAACKAHDRCYEQEDQGLLSCACDMALLTALASLTATPDKLNMRSAIAAAAIFGWFSQSDCECHEEGGQSRPLVKPSFKDKMNCL